MKLIIKQNLADYYIKTGDCRKQIELLRTERETIIAGALRNDEKCIYNKCPKKIKDKYHCKYIKHSCHISKDNINYINYYLIDLRYEGPLSDIMQFIIYFSISTKTISHIDTSVFYLDLEDVVKKIPMFKELCDYLNSKEFMNLLFLVKKIDFFIYNIHTKIRYIRTSIL